MHGHAPETDAENLQLVGEVEDLARARRKFDRGKKRVPAFSRSRAQASSAAKTPAAVPAETAKSAAVTKSLPKRVFIETPAIAEVFPSRVKKLKTEMRASPLFSPRKNSACGEEHAETEVERMVPAGASGARRVRPRHFRARPIRSRSRFMFGLKFALPFFCASGVAFSSGFLRAVVRGVGASADRAPFLSADGGESVSAFARRKEVRR